MIDELQTTAALHALDLLEGMERQAFESLAQENDEARDARAEFGRVAFALTQVAPSKTPSPELRERLLAQIRSDAAPKPRPAELELAPGLRLVFAERLQWQETGVPGVRVKPLYVDQGRRYASNLVSMAAGSVYPRHWHADLEELFMLAGELTVAGHRLRSGDYCRAEPGSVHDEVTAESDCTFIALTSLRNEFRPNMTPGAAGT